MSKRSERDEEFLVVHATDLMPDAQRTFDHALAVARKADARLVSLHVAPSGLESDKLEESRQMMERLCENYDGEHHEMILETGEDEKKVLLKKVRQMVPDLLVVGTRRQASEGRGKRGGQSVSELAALETDVPTLVVHIGQEGLVDGNGQLRLQRVLLPVGDGAEARDTIRGLTTFLDRLGVEEIDIHLLRVGDPEVLEHLLLPERKGWRWHRQVQKRGFVAKSVAELCEALDIDLIAMATRGKDGFIDVFSGTHTEKVIRRAPRPVLVNSARDEV